MNCTVVIYVDIFYQLAVHWLVTSLMRHHRYWCLASLIISILHLFAGRLERKLSITSSSKVIFKTVFTLPGIRDVFERSTWSMIDQLTVQASLADKPSFRWILEEQEKDINDLETILDKVFIFKFWLLSEFVDEYSSVFNQRLSFGIPTFYSMK